MLTAVAVNIQRTPDDQPNGAAVSMDWRRGGTTPIRDTGCDLSPCLLAPVLLRTLQFELVRGGNGEHSTLGDATASGRPAIRPTTRRSFDLPAG